MAAKKRFTHNQQKRFAIIAAATSHASDALRNDKRLGWTNWVSKYNTWMAELEGRTEMAQDDAECVCLYWLRQLIQRIEPATHEEILEYGYTDCRRFKLKVDTAWHYGRLKDISDSEKLERCLAHAKQCNRQWTHGRA